MEKTLKVAKTNPMHRPNTMHGDYFGDQFFAIEECYVDSYLLLGLKSAHV
jgi:hypothetical protein